MDPDEYHAYKPLLGNPDLVPIIEKRLGGKEKKLIYGSGETPPATFRPPGPNGRPSS